MLGFREDAVLGRDDEDLGDGVQREEQQRFQGGEGVGEVDQSRYEDEDIEDDRAHVTQCHD